MNPLFHVAAGGLLAYARSAFRLRVLGPPRFRLEPGTLVVSTHRSDSDLPVLVGGLYGRSGTWRENDPRIHFAVRDDMLLPGFFAGYPTGLPRRVRTLLYPLGAERALRSVHCHPIRSASRMRLAEIAAEEPALALDAVFPPRVVADLRGRAIELGLPRPALTGDVDRGEYADLLWRVHSREELTAPELADAWSGRAARATGDFRQLVQVVRDGGALLIFPEGRPSPDGSIGPLMPGIEALIRRARPATLRPVALAYDPLVRGRTRAYVGVGERVELAERPDEAGILRLLRRTTPLTCGQIVAPRLLERPDITAAELEADLVAALRGGRPFDPELADPHTRQARIAEALEAGRGADEPVLARLATELESASH